MTQKSVQTKKKVSYEQIVVSMKRDDTVLLLNIIRIINTNYRWTPPFENDCKMTSNLGA